METSNSSGTSGAGDRDPLSAAKISCTEEDAIVLDRWLWAACDEDGLQFPAHRRPQYGPYVTHARYVAQQKVFVAGTFVYPKRDGAKELATLQKLVAGIEQRDEVAIRQLSKVAKALATLYAQSPGLAPVEERAAELAGAGYVPLGNEGGEREGTPEACMAQRYIAKLRAREAERAAALAELEEIREARQTDWEAVQERCQALEERYDALTAECDLLAAPLRESAEAIAAAMNRQAEQQLRRAPSLHTLASAEAGGASRLAEGRAALVAAAAEASALREELINKERAHGIRVQSLQQLLRDRQEVVLRLRRTARQRAGQVRVLRTLVAEARQRLADEQREYATGEADASYTDSLRKFHSLLVERTSEKWYGTAQEDAEGGGGAAPAVAQARPLERRATLDSATVTPRKQPALSPAMQRVQDSVGHRSRYELVRHLQRWEDALAKDRATLQAALEDGGNATPAQRVKHLEELLVNPAAKDAAAAAREGIAADPTEDD